MLRLLSSKVVKGWQYKGYWVLYRSTLLCRESLDDNWHVQAPYNITHPTFSNVGTLKQGLGQDLSSIYFGQMKNNFSDKQKHLNFHFFDLILLMTIYFPNNPSLKMWVKCKMPFLTQYAKIIVGITISRGWVAKSWQKFCEWQVF